MDKKKIIAVISLIVIGTAGYYLWGYYQAVINRGKITASGTIEAIEVQVGSKVSGRLLESPADEGSFANKGDVIAKIDVPELVQQYEAGKAFESAARSRANNAQADYKRISELYESNMASEQQLDSARALADAAGDALLQARANARTAKIQLDNGTIAAPISGTILVKAVQAGELVSAGSTILTMANLTNLELKVYVSEKQVGRVNLGDDVFIHVDSYPKEDFLGKVKYISNKAEFTPKNIQTKEERVNQVFGVKIYIPNPDLKLKPGMPADAEIKIQNPLRQSSGQAKS